MFTCTVSAKGWGKSLSCSSLGVSDSVTDSGALSVTANSLLRANPC